MNKLTGTIIDAGYHLDAGPGVSIAANAGELRVWDGPLYGRRVVVVDETDYDARETEMAELSSALATARAVAAWLSPCAEQLADVVRVMRKIEGGTQE